MFTGIVQGIAEVIKIVHESNFKTITILMPEELSKDIRISNSISINGCCLSVVAVNENEISFNIIDETLKLTNLNQIQLNQFVNIERSAHLNDEIGGHFLSGHIIDVASVKNIIKEDSNCKMNIKITNKEVMKYIFYKGYIGIDGMSITIGKVHADYFVCHLIPDTINKTIMQFKKEGDTVNIEIDTQTQIIVDTVERVLKEHYTNPACFCNVKED